MFPRRSPERSAISSFWKKAKKFRPELELWPTPAVRESKIFMKILKFQRKKPKNGELGKDEKEQNKALSKVRVIVENILGDIKVFRIMSDRRRIKRIRFNLKFRIISGIVNMKNGFV